MMKIVGVLLLVVAVSSLPVDELAGDGVVSLVVNGDEGSLPQDIVGVDVNTIEGGDLVKSEKLLPKIRQEAPIIAVPIPEFDSRPIPALPEDILPVIPAIPEDTLLVRPAIPEDYPLVKPALPEVGVPQTKPALPEVGVPETKPALPEIGLPETKPALPGVPETKPALPETGIFDAVPLPGVVDQENGGGQQVPSGEIYRSDLVSVTLNHVGTALSTVSGWFSMVINTFSGTEVESSQIVV